MLPVVEIYVLSLETASPPPLFVCHTQLALPYHLGDTFAEVSHLDNQDALNPHKYLQAFAR